MTIMFTVLATIFSIIALAWIWITIEDKESNVPLFPAALALICVIVLCTIGATHSYTEDRTLERAFEANLVTTDTALNNYKQPYRVLVWSSNAIQYAIMDEVR